MATNTYENFNGTIYAAICKPFTEFCQIVAPVLSLRANHWKDQKELFSVYQEALFMDSKVVVHHRQKQPIAFNNIWQDCNGSLPSFIVTIETAINRSLISGEYKRLKKLFWKCTKQARQKTLVTNTTPSGLVKRSDNSIGAWQNREAITLKSQMLGQTASGKTRGHLMVDPQAFNYRSAKAQLKAKLHSGAIDQASYKVALNQLKEYRTQVIQYLEENQDKLKAEMLNNRSGSGVRVVDNAEGVEKESVAKPRNSYNGYDSRYYEKMDAVAENYKQGLISTEEADQARQQLASKAISK